jgi:hypothetical protein
MFFSIVVLIACSHRVQDPDVDPSSPPTFLLKLQNEEELIFNFTFVLRQQQPGKISAQAVDTVINGLTFIFAASLRELDNLTTRELHADPNLHKNNPNVQLVGDYSTSGSSSVQFQWTWKWKPPKASDDKGRGWRTCCSVCGTKALSNSQTNVSTVCRIRSKKSQIRSSRNIFVLGQQYVLIPSHRVIHSNTV